MRLATRHDGAGGLRAAILADGLLVDAAAAAARAGMALPGAGTVREMLALGPDERERLDAAAFAIAAAGPGPDAHEEASVRLAAPVPDAGKVICVGLNYAMHADEAELDATAVPTLFAKWSNALAGSGAPIVLRDAYADAVDYEAELAVVVGRRARDLDEASALDAVAGWMALNDVSARDRQTETSQWTAGKAIDGFAPCGPHLVLDHAFAEPGLALRTHVNGELLQDSDTTQMLFSVPRLLAFVSSLMTLEPGDVLATGTPAGVGAHRTPQRFLRDGDVVEVSVGDERLVNTVARVGAGASAPPEPAAAP